MTATLAVAAIAVVVSAATLSMRPLSVDEAWFFQVCKRVSGGERLYRDVFYGAGPVAVWAVVAAFWLTRPQGLVARSFALTYRVATPASVAAVIIGAGGSNLAALATGLLAIALAGPQVAFHNHYGLLTIASIVAGTGALLFGHLIAAGTLLGLAIVSKYPLGLAALALLGSAVIMGSGIADLGPVMIGVALVVGAVGVGLGRTGIEWMIERAVRNKRVFLESGRLSPSYGLRLIWGRRAVGPMTRVMLSLPFVAPIVVVPIVTYTAVAHGDLVTYLAAALALLAIVGWYPRADLAHVSPVAALGVAALGIALVAMRAGDAVWLTLAGLGAIAIAGPLWMTLRHRPGSVRRDVPSFKFIPVAKSGRPWPDQTEPLIEAVGPDIFLLDPYAPMVYSAGAVKNPTPFDYPFNTTFGPNGQAAVIESIRSGEVENVCVGTRAPKHFQPAELYAFVDEAMVVVAECEFGAIKQLRTDDANGAFEASEEGS